MASSARINSVKNPDLVNRALNSIQISSSEQPILKAILLSSSC